MSSNVPGAVAFAWSGGRTALAWVSEERALLVR